MDIIIENGTVVNEGRLEQRDIFIHDGRIAGSAAELQDSRYERVDATGCYVLPGVIDTHVHFRDGGDGSNPAGDFHTESRAALAGGVTSVIDMPNTQPQTTTVEALEAKERMAATKSAVNYGFMLGATHDNIDWLLGLDPTRYAAIKLFLGSSTGNMLVNDPDLLDKLFAESKKLIVAHCEEEHVVQANMVNLKAEFEGTEKETAALHPKVRNTEACFLATYKAVERARKYNTRLHIAHLSTATELDLLSNRSVEEKRITAEVTPNHLWFDDRDYEQLGNRIKCNPAIKSNDDRLALWAGLFDGLIDTIGTDHAPHPLEAKEKPYFQAPSGIPSIQHALQMMLEGLFNPATRLDDPAAQQDLLASWLPLFVEKMSHNPARIFGIRERGFLREGYHADTVVVRPLSGEGQRIEKANLLYKCGWSPLEEQQLHTEIVRTIINGDKGGEALEFKI